MTSLRKFCLILLAFTSISLAQTGSTFYVSKTGKDTNSGSFTAPWLTIQHAASPSTAGATVYRGSRCLQRIGELPCLGNSIQSHHFRKLSRDRPRRSMAPGSASLARRV